MPIKRGAANNIFPEFWKMLCMYSDVNNHLHIVAVETSEKIKKLSDGIDALSSSVLIKDSSLRCYDLNLRRFVVDRTPHAQEDSSLQ